MVITQNISDANCLTNCVALHLSPEGEAGCLTGVYFGHFVLQPLTIFFILVVIKKVILAIKGGI